MISSGTTNVILWVIFDIGGIVVSENSDRIVAQLEKEFGIPVNRLAQAIQVYQDSVTRGECTLQQVYRYVVDDLGLDVDPMEILNRHLMLFRESSTRHDPDVVAFIDRLKINHSVACFTNTEREIAEICRETGLFDYFNRSYLSVELGRKKPDSEAYAAVLDDLSCRPQDVIFVDDRVENVEGAKSVGMHALRFTNLAQLEDDLSRLCLVLRP